MYIVLMRGMFLQEIVGVFKSKSEAKRILALRKAEEENDYHDFEIKEIEVNKYVGIR